MKDMQTADLFEFDNRFSARQAKNTTLAKIVGKAGHEWMTAALLAIHELEPGVYSGETIRIRVLEKGLRKPHHHNAWGALINMAVKRKLLVDTGRMTNMRETRSHARRTPLYTRGDNEKTS